MLTWLLHQGGTAPDTFNRLRPDFLIISPPKTGSSWLAANLRCHPQVFVPSIKEVKYFSSFMRWLDWSWYLHQFDPAGERLKGEASPSYALLPVERIRLVRRLLPDLKLIFLMREPIARAWSHAKHNYRFREATFAGCEHSFADVAEEQWRANVNDDWSLASGDYLGQLRRWLAVFPREQLFVGFYESITSDPEGLLRAVLAFLGADPRVDMSGFPLHERILAGLNGDLPVSLECHLQGLLHERTVQLAAFVRECFKLEPPPTWQKILTPGAQSPSPGSAFQRAFDDVYLTQVLRREETFPSARCQVLSGYRGYDIALHQGRLYALDTSLGGVRVGDLPEAELRSLMDARRCLVADSLVDIKEQVDRHVFETAQAGWQALATLQAELHSTRAELRTTREELRAARDELGRLEHGLAKAAHTLHWLETDCRWYAAAARVLRRAWQRLGRTSKDQRLMNHT
ncbi:MAG TPA: sulfotransferase domain-containing protein [Gemmataceae bacterium]|nr:sulfotransferase domain-containing protein [Gemmataceae bacterium]